MKKFLLINSPIFWNSTDDTEDYLSPIGLAYIATYLEKAGICVELVDCVKERISVNSIIDIILKSKPDFLGINIFTQNYDIVKHILENIPIKCDCFIGGQVVKSIYDDIMNWNVQNNLNIIMGEGEFIIPSIVTNSCKEQPFKQTNNKFVYKVNKDSEYFPQDISTVDLNRKYLGKEILINHYGEKEVGIITSRGCIYNCAFCGGARSLNSDTTIRMRNETSITNEITEIVMTYPDIQCIRILDDLFLRDGSSIDKAYRIFKKFPQLNWRGMAHILSLKKSIDRVEELKQSRCKELFIGIESGSRMVRKRINKLGNIEDIVEVSKIIHETGIDIKGYFIFGFPEETKEEFDDTYQLAYRLSEISKHTLGVFRTSVFQFRPYHGTQLYQEIIDDIGVIPSCATNDKINVLSGRSQFNFSSGNYSSESDELLNEYIIKTQRLSEQNNVTRN